MDQATPPLERLRPFAEDEIACKICGGAARKFGRVDFSRNCEEVRGKRLPSTGILIGYRRCATCSFIFTDAFDDWSPADWAAAVYNDAYAEVDPDYAGRRPDASAAMVVKLFGSLAGQLRVLDYGGGSGRLAQRLRDAGFTQAATFDPFHPEHATRPDGRFTLVTCFETVEHMPDPKAGAADLAGFLGDDALLLFSTVLQPPEIGQIGLGWWYVGPRNGHISLHSQDSLRRLWAGLGMQTVTLGGPVHVAFRKLPSFVRLKAPA
jgi:2-polyprenyl-6-hydroxyphenyl methylase/3-demethylubiquinone-9 3-methyltransferase